MWIVCYEVPDAHKNALNRWVEMGFSGLTAYVVLLGAVAVGGLRLILRGERPISQRLAAAAVIASVVGRSVEQLVGIPHLTDEALFWTLLGVIVAAPMLADGPLQGGENSPRVKNVVNVPLLTGSRALAPVLWVASALVLASVVLGFTLVKNVNYALAESRATSASNLLVSGAPENAMRSINSAISLAPDVGRYHVIRSNILDQARSSRPGATEQAKPALAAYQANGRA